MSTCTQRVLCTANELGLKLEVVPVDLMKGEHKGPAFMKMQPFGQIPVLEDDGFFVYESRAICQYLCDKAGAKSESIFPKDPKKRAIVQQMISVEISNFTSGVSALVFETVFKKWKGLGDADPAKVEEHRKKTSDCLDVYEKILKDKQYVCGNDFTIADIFHIPYAAMAVGAAGQSDLFENPARPNVNAWWKRISSRPSWVAASQPPK